MKTKDKEFQTTDLDLLPEEEKNALLRILKKLPTTKGLDIEVYKEIITFFQAKNVFTNNEQEIRDSAVKLTIVFGSLAAAKKYLTNFKPTKLYEDEEIPTFSFRTVHDACLFYLPQGNDWDLELWREIILNNRPSHPKDMIMRLLPFLAKIQHYVRSESNEKEIKEYIRKNIVEQFVKEFAKDYDDLSLYPAYPDFLNYFMDKNKKIIQKEIRLAIDKHLNIPKGKLTDKQREEFNDKKKEKADELEAIEKKIKENYEQQTLEYYKDTFQNYADKEDYIAKKIAKNKGIIESTARKAYLELKTEFKAPIADLSFYASKFNYKRAEESPKAAALFFKLSIPEAQFHEYLTLKPQNDDTLIPPVYIKGSDIHSSYAKYYIKKMAPSNPRAAVLGDETGCCQSLGKAGSYYAKYGIENKKAGFYVFFIMKGRQPSEEDTIVSQCLAVNDEKSNMLLDTVEPDDAFAKHHEMALADLYTYLGYELVTNHGFSRVTVGKFGKTPERLGVIEAIPIYTSDKKYTDDSKAQRIIADSSLPIMDVYKTLNPDSLLDFEQFKMIPTSKSLLAWADLCAMEKRTASVFLLTKPKLEEPLSFCDPYLKSVNLSKDILLNRYTLTRGWIDLLIKFADTPSYYNSGKKTPPPNYNQVKEYINKGLDPNIPVPFYYRFGYFGAERGAVGSMLAIFTASGDKKAVVDLIKHGADVNALDRVGSSVLYRAFFGKHWDIVHYLLENGANPNQFDVEKNHFLREAIKGSPKSMLSLLIKHGIIIESDNEVLRETAEEGNKAAFTVLLEVSLIAEPKAREQGKYLPLFELAIKIGQTEIVQCLFNAGIPCDSPIKIMGDALRKLYYEHQVNILPHFVRFSENKRNEHINHYKDEKKISYEKLKFYESRVVSLIEIFSCYGPIEFHSLAKMALEMDCKPLKIWFESQGIDYQDITSEDTEALAMFINKEEQKQIRNWINKHAFGLLKTDTDDKAKDTSEEPESILMPLGQEEKDHHLYLAIKLNDLSKVRKLLAEGANPNAALPETCTEADSLLHLALINQNDDIVRELIFMGAKTDDHDVKHYPAIKQAVEVNHLIQKLPNKPYLNIADIILTLMNSYNSIGNLTHTSWGARTCADKIIESIIAYKLHTLLPTHSEYDPRFRGFFGYIDDQLNPKPIKPYDPTFNPSKEEPLPTLNTYGSYRGLLLYISNENTYKHLIDKIGQPNAQIANAHLLGNHGTFKMKPELRGETTTTIVPGEPR